jgi:hypothetical protein
MKFSVAGVVRVFSCRVSNGPVLLPEGYTILYWCVTYRLLLSGTLDRLRKLDMVQHCKWIAYGTDGSGGKLEGCTRMRPKLHPGLPVFGHAFPGRVIGGMA